MLKDMFALWQRQSDLMKLQYAYAVVVLVTLVVAGLVGLLNQTVARQIVGISGIAASYAPSAAHAGILISTAMFFGSFAYPAGATAVQSMAPARLRARFAALYLFAVTLVAATLGPTIVALFTDLVLKDPARIGEALALTILTAAPIGLIASLAGARQLSRRQPLESI